MTKKVKIYLIDAYLSYDLEGSDRERRLNESMSLLRTLNYELLEYHTFRLTKIENRTYLTKGALDIALEELSFLGDEVKVVLTFDASPSQIQNLKNILGREVIDRTQLIVAIFSMHAKSKESRIQVDLAEISYRLSALTQSDLNYDQDTSSGRGYTATRGVGEKQIALDRRLLSKRRDHLQKELNKIKSNRDVRRRKRINSAYPIVSLVGYTNAGKSSLMNAFLKLAKKDNKQVVVEDKLFTTLDTSTRLIEIKNYPSFILIDTVGIIENLPIELVKAFRSTYEEACSSTLIIDVIDISSSHYENDRISAQKMLEELGIESIDRIDVYNKIDQYYGNVFQKESNALYISTYIEEDIYYLLDEISKRISKDWVSFKMNLPFEEPFYRLSKFAYITKKIETNEGLLLEGKINPSVRKYYQKYFTNLDGFDIN